MKKKIVALLVTLIFVLNCLCPVFALADDGIAATRGAMYLKFYDVNEFRYVNEGEPLYPNRFYEVEVWLSGLGEVLGGSIPLHFNNKVVQIVSYYGNDVLENDINGEGDFPLVQLPNGSTSQSVDGLINSQSSWGTLLNVSPYSPQICNSKGLIFVDFYHESYDKSELSKDSKMFSFKIKTLKSGETEFREATYALDGANSTDQAPDGAFFSSYYDNGDAYAFYTNSAIEAKVVSDLVNGVNLVQDRVEVEVNKTVQLTANVLPSTAANKKVTWKSDNPEIATVDANGLVKGITDGETKITVQTDEGGFIDTCKVNVRNPDRPSTPGYVRFTMATGKRVKIQWGESTGASGVTGYNIYRDGVHIATVTNGLEYVDFGGTIANPDKTFSRDTGYDSYTVEAFYNDLKSQKTPSKIAYRMPPSISSIYPEKYSYLSSSDIQNISMYFDNEHPIALDNIKVEYVSTNGMIWQECPVENLYVSSYYASFDVDFSKLTFDGSEYMFRYTVTDIDGCSTVSETLMYGIVFPPEPVNIRALAAAKKIIVSWDPSVSNFTTQYYVYRRDASSDWKRVATVSGRENVYYEDTNVVNGTMYDYYVQVVDKYNQLSEKSNIVKDICPGEDKEAPVVMSISPNDGTTLNGTYKITAKLSDNIGVVKSEIYCSYDDEKTWELLTTKTGKHTEISYQLDTTKISQKNIKIKVVAYDNDGNESDGTPVRSYIIDNVGPEKVTNVKGNADSATQVTVTWDDVTDNDRFYFIVEQKMEDGSFKAVSKEVYYTKGEHIKDLTPSTTYTFRVVAYDKVGNRGIPSDEVTVTTKADEVTPIVTQITPNARKTNSNLKMTFTATDNSAVQSLQVQVSFDGIVWINAGNVIQASKPSKQVVFEHELDISTYKDGYMWVRGVPTDIYGNVGEDSNLSFNQYYLDRKGPEAPKNVSATCTDTYIEIKWAQATEGDIDYYVVTRATEKNGEYKAVSNKLSTLNFFDYTAQTGVTYYYKVYAVDDMGNVGAYSEPAVSGMKVADTTKPEIDGLLPANGSIISQNRSIEVFAYDNNKVSDITLEYKSVNSNNWIVVDTLEGEKGVFSISNLNLGEGEYNFRAKATDTAKNSSDYSNVYTYTIDNTAPVVKNVNVTSGVEKIDISWEIAPNEDLYYVTVYYKNYGKTIYKNAAQRSKSTSGKYSCTLNVPVGYEYVNGYREPYKYVAKIVAVDVAGNTYEFLVNRTGTNVANGTENDGKYITVSEPPIEFRVENSVPDKMVAGSEVQMLSRIISRYSWEDVTYSWDFGDGTTSLLSNPSKKYENPGEYEVTFVAKGSGTRESRIVKKVKVYEPEYVGKYDITLVDDNGCPLSDVSVLFNCDNAEKMVEYRTDKNGVVKINAPQGTYNIGFYKDGYLPSQKSVSFINSTTQVMTVRLVEKNIVIGNLSWTPMTLEEIVDAGIDISSPASQNLFKYEITLIIGEETVTITGHKSLNDETPIKVTDQDFTFPGEDGKNNMTDADGKFTNNTIYIYDFNNKDNGYEYNKDEDTDVPRTIITYVQVPGEVSWLKEFFNVSLSVFNQAESEFVINDCYATLNYPTDGLTLIESGESGNPKTVSLGAISGQQGKDVTWILRGDKAGEYDISADFTGVVGIMKDEQFVSWEQEINARFESDKPITVYGNNGLSLIIELEDDVTPEDDYMVRIGLKNAGVLTRYNPNVPVLESEDISLVEGYQNYKELLGGNRETNVKDLKYSEVVYTNFIINGIQDDQGIQEILMQRLKESNINLPAAYKVVKSLSFHNRKLEIFHIDESGKEVPVKSINSYMGKDTTFIAYVSEMLPGSTEYTPCKDIKLYFKDITSGSILDTNGVVITEGLTDEDGEFVFVYKAPASATKLNNKFVVKGNRTEESVVHIQLINNDTKVDGHIHDKFGNPIKNVDVTIVTREKQVTAKTDKNGKFTIKDTLKAGPATITLAKDAYKTISEDVNLDAGKATLIYTMERLLVKPKITSVTANNIGKFATEVIIPEGLDVVDELKVKTSTEDNSKVVSYRVEVVNENGEIETSKEFDNKNKKIELETKMLSAGDKVRIIAVNDAGTESNPYYLPIEVSKAPFAHLLNLKEMKLTKDEINGKISFTNLFGNVKDKNNNSAYWLIDDAKAVWEELFRKFAVKFTMDGGIDNESGSETEYVIDWFAYKNFNVYVNYNFETGELKISPKNLSGNHTVDEYITNGIKNPNSNKKDTTGYLTIGETVPESMKDVDYKGKYSYLEAYSELQWDIGSYFGITFDFDGYEWKGTFKMGVNEDSGFKGSYLRKVPTLDNLTWSSKMPEYLAGTWYKSLLINETANVALTEEGINASEMKMDYSASTNAGWENGMQKIVLGTEIENTIYMLPELKVEGWSKSTGGYHLLGYWKPIYANDTYSEYTEYPVNTLSLFSAEEEDKLAPVSLLSVDETPAEPGVIEKGVFANSEMALLDEENPMMVYLKSDKSVVGNGSVIASRVYENGVWKESQLVSNNGTNDYNPSIVRTENGVVAVWTDASNSVTDSNDLTLEQIQTNVAKNLTISAAEYDAENKVWKEAAQLSGNDFLNYEPEVAKHNDGAVAVWIANEENDMVSEERNDSIMFSVFGNTVLSDGTVSELKSWSDAKKIPGILGTVSDVTLTEKNGVVYLLYALTSAATYVGDDNQEHERVVKKYYLMTYNGEWSVAKVLNSGDSPDIYCGFFQLEKDDGSSTLELVLISGTLMYRIDAKTRVITENKPINDVVMASNEISVASHGNKLTVSWLTNEKGQKINTMIYDVLKNTWSEEIEVDTIDAKYIATDLETMLDADGLTAFYNRYEYVENNRQVELKDISLCATNMPFGQGVSVESIEALDSAVLIGSDVRFVLEIKNNGSETANGFKVTITDKNTGDKAIDSTFVVDDVLLGGASEFVEFSCPVGSLTDNFEVMAYVNDDISNAVSTELIVANAEISEFEAKHIDDGIVMVSATVKNTGYVPITRDVALYNIVSGSKTTFKDAKGNVIQPVKVENLGVNEESTVIFEVADISEIVKFDVELIRNAGEKEIFDNDDAKKLTFVPDSILVTGSVTTVWKDSAFKTRSGNSLELNLSSVKVDVMQDNEIIADASTESADNVASYKAMIPSDEKVDIVVSAPGYLARKVADNASGNILGLIAGDVYQDEFGNINDRDLNAMIYMIGEIKPENEDEHEKWNAFKFVNDGNNAVSALDLLVLLKNYGAGQLTYELMNKMGQ